MSTRYEVTRLNEDGAFESIFFKGYAREVAWHVIDEIKTSLYSAAAVECFFRDHGIYVFGPDVLYQFFANEREYRVSLTEGNSSLVEYIYLWDVRRAQWSVIFLNARWWRTHRLDCAGVVLSPNLRHGAQKRTGSTGDDMPFIQPSARAPALTQGDSIEETPPPVARCRRADVDANVPHGIDDTSPRGLSLKDVIAGLPRAT